VFFTIDDEDYCTLVGIQLDVGPQVVEDDIEP
jgi:hypothetical protein